MLSRLHWCRAMLMFSFFTGRGGTYRVPLAQVCAQTNGVSARPGRDFALFTPAVEYFSFCSFPLFCFVWLGLFGLVCLSLYFPTYIVFDLVFVLFCIVLFGLV